MYCIKTIIVLSSILHVVWLSEDAATGGAPSDQPLNVIEKVGDKTQDEIVEIEEADEPLDGVGEMDESNETPDVGKEIGEPDDVDLEYADDSEYIGTGKEKDDVEKDDGTGKEKDDGGEKDDYDDEEESVKDNDENEKADIGDDGTDTNDQNEEKYEHKYQFPYNFYEMEDLEKQKQLMGGKIPAEDVQLFVTAFPNHRDELEKGKLPRELLIDFLETTEEYYDEDYKHFLKFYTDSTKEDSRKEDPMKEDSRKEDPIKDSRKEEL